MVGSVVSFQLTISFKFVSLSSSSSPSLLPTSNYTMSNRAISPTLREMMDSHSSSRSVVVPDSSYWLL
jgi:hypothetical protein